MTTCQRRPSAVLAAAPVLLLCLSLSGPGAAAKVIRVHGVSGSDAPANDGSTWAKAKKTISAAVGIAATGDELWVTGTNYPEHITDTLGLAFYGGFFGDEATRAARHGGASILDATNTGTAVAFNNGSANKALLDGFTVTGGQPGISCAGFSVVRNCVITGNNSASTSGGISVSGSAAVTIVNNTLRGNSATAGSAIYTAGTGTITIADNLIVENVSTLGGAAIYVYSGGPTVAGNTIARNSGYPYGGGIENYIGNPVVTNNIVAFNLTGIRSLFAGNYTLSHNLVYGNYGQDYSSTTPGATDITANPRFADVYAGNYHIQNTSPARNAGDAAAVAAGDLDMDGQARVLNGTVDIGADESDGSVYTTPTVVVRVAASSGSDTNTGASWAAPKLTIQAALDAIPYGGEVWVKQGTYPELVSVKTNAESFLRGGFAGDEVAPGARHGGPSVIDAAGFQNPNGYVTAVGFTSNPKAMATMEGFTVIHGEVGIQTALNTLVTLSKNIIRDNANDHVSGGGILISPGANVIVSTNLIVSNTAQHGAGISIREARATITNNIIADNALSSNGTGGIIDVEDSTLTLTNNTIARNDAGPIGRALDVSVSTLSGGNNIIAFNSSGLYGYDDTLAFSHNLVFGNDKDNYSGQFTADPADVSMDPKFASLSLGNFHIQPASPARNAGDNALVSPNATDMDSQPRIQDTTVDIGADESDGTVYSIPRPIVRVDGVNGSNAKPGDSWANAKRTIESALSALPFGGDVWVKEGTYNNTHLVLNGAEGIGLYGGFAGDELLLTDRHGLSSVLDGAGTGVIVAINTPTGSTTTVDAFGIRTAEQGVVVGPKSRAVITHSNILACVSAGNGAGVNAGNGADVTLAYNTIVANTAAQGGGLYVAGGTVQAYDNEISDNRATTAGAGICIAGGSASLTNNTIARNLDAPTGAGLFLGGGTFTVANNIIAANTSGVAWTGGGTLNFSSNDVWNNAADGSAGYQGSLGDRTGQNGNISADPKFADLNDGRLQAGSPAVDAGDNVFVTGARDRFGMARIQGRSVDMGAYESPYVRLTLADAARALSAAGGLLAATPADMAGPLNAVTGDAPEALTLRDAIRLLRKIRGLDPNP